MNPNRDFLEQAVKHIRLTLESVRPALLEAQGNIEHRLKDDASVVTEMDTFVENKLKAALAEFDGGIAFGGEETGVDYSKETFWLADPIDGTEQFIRGIPMSTNMLSLIHNNEPVLGIVYNFELGDFYHAIQGNGAYRNGHAIHVSDRKPDRAWITASVKAGEPFGLIDELRKLVKSVRNFGAAGFDYSLIASGGLDGTIRYHGHGSPWDFAPTTLLVQEADGRVVNIGSNSYDYRQKNHIAASPAIFDLLKKYMDTVDTHGDGAT